eukprot:5081564-Pyramimonas_sp.AAC.1
MKKAQEAPPRQIVVSVHALRIQAEGHSKFLKDGPNDNTYGIYASCMLHHPVAVELSVESTDQHLSSWRPRSLSART